jgi:hypothetical protein
MLRLYAMEAVVAYFEVLFPFVQIKRYRYHHHHHHYHHGGMRFEVLSWANTEATALLSVTPCTW